VIGRSSSFRVETSFPLGIDETTAVEVSAEVFIDEEKLSFVVSLPNLPRLADSRKLMQIKPEKHYVEFIYNVAVKCHAEFATFDTDTGKVEFMLLGHLAAPS